MSAMKSEAREIPEKRETYETGNEPEFLVFDMVKWEDAGDGLIRLFVASKHGKTNRMEYTFVCKPERLASNCRKGLLFAAEAHNLFVMRGPLGGH